MQQQDPLKIQPALEVVRQKRLRRDHAASAEERMARFELLQATWRKTLDGNPRARELVCHRNHRRRRQSLVRELEAKLRGKVANLSDGGSQHA